MKTQHDHYDRLSVRLSVIISRLLAGESLELKALADEFGVSERTLQRDFQQRLIHLDLEHRALSSPVTQTACFLELAEAIRDYRAVTLLVNGKSYEAVAPRRLIFQSKNWFLVATRTRNLQVFRMEDVNAVTVLDTSFRRKPELDALTASEEFISALPHFRFISDVIQTFRE